jgi:hypothetical protein
MDAMEPADSISRLGFSRWYERRLVEGHAWFVSGILCMVAVPACFEELTYRGSVVRLLFYAGVVTAAALVGVYGLNRYLRILVEAEQIGEHATCAACGAYAKFKLVSESRAHCRRCGNEWQLLGPR